MTVPWKMDFSDVQFEDEQPAVATSPEPPLEASEPPLGTITDEQGVMYPPIKLNTAPWKADWSDVTFEKKPEIEQLPEPEPQPSWIWEGIKDVGRKLRGDEVRETFFPEEEEFKQPNWIMEGAKDFVKGQATEMSRTALDVQAGLAGAEYSLLNPVVAAMEYVGELTGLVPKERKMESRKFLEGLQEIVDASQQQQAEQPEREMAAGVARGVGSLPLILPVLKKIIPKLGWHAFAVLNAYEALPSGDPKVIAKAMADGYKFQAAMSVAGVMPKGLQVPANAILFHALSAQEGAPQGEAMAQGIIGGALAAGQKGIPIDEIAENLRGKPKLLTAETRQPVAETERRTAKNIVPPEVPQPLTEQPATVSAVPISAQPATAGTQAVPLGEAVSQPIPERAVKTPIQKGAASDLIVIPKTEIPQEVTDFVEVLKAANRVAETGGTGKMPVRGKDGAIAKDSNGKLIWVNQVAAYPEGWNLKKLQRLERAIERVKTGKTPTKLQQRALDEAKTHKNMADEVYIDHVEGQELKAKYSELIEGSSEAEAKYGKPVVPTGALVYHNGEWMAAKQEGNKTLLRDGETIEVKKGEQGKIKGDKIVQPESPEYEEALKAYIEQEGGQTEFAAKELSKEPKATINEVPVTENVKQQEAFTDVFNLVGEKESPEIVAKREAVKLKAEQEQAKAEMDKKQQDLFAPPVPKVPEGKVETGKQAEAEPPKPMELKKRDIHILASADKDGWVNPQAGMDKKSVGAVTGIKGLIKKGLVEEVQKVVKNGKTYAKGWRLTEEGRKLDIAGRETSSKAELDELDRRMDAGEDITKPITPSSPQRLNDISTENYGKGYNSLTTEERAEVNKIAEEYKAVEQPEAKTETKAEATPAKQELPAEEIKGNQPGKVVRLAGQGPRQFEIVKELPKQEGDLPEEIYYDVKDVKTGEVIPNVEKGDLLEIKNRGGPGAAAAASMPGDTGPVYEFGLGPEQHVVSGGQKPKGFLNRVLESGKISKKVEAKLSKESKTYAEQPTAEIMTKIRDWLALDKKNVVEAEERFNNPASDADTKGAIGMALYEHYRKTKNYDAQARIATALDEVFRGGGRLVQSASLFNKMSGNAWSKLVDEYLAKRKVEVGKDIPNDVLKEIKSDLTNAARMDDPVIKQQTIQKALEKLVAHVPMKASDWLDAYRYTNMLSNPQSHMRNAIGNLTNIFILKPSASAMHGDLYSAGKQIKKSFQRIFSPEPWRAAKEAFNRGEMDKLAEFIDDPSMSIFDIVKRGVGPKNPLLDKLWKLNTAIPKAMNAVDVWSGNVLEASEITRLKQKGLSAEGAQKRAKEVSQELLYRNPMEGLEDTSRDLSSRFLEKLGKNIENMRLKVPGAKWVIPFLKTPLRITQLGVKASPLAYWDKPLGLGRKMNVEAIAEAKYGKPFEKLTKSEQLSVSDELYMRQGLGRLGLAVTAIGGLMAYAGMTTWAAPKDKKARQLFYASGRVPYSFYFKASGMDKGKWVSMAYLGPLMIAFAIPAAAKGVFEEDPKAAGEEWYERVAEAAFAIPRMVLAQTPVSGLSGIFDVLSQDYDKTFLGELEKMGTQLIPASGFMRWVSKIVDPYYRKAKKPGETILTGLPILSRQIKAIMGPDKEPAPRDIVEPFIPFRIATEEERFEMLLQERMNLLKLHQEQKKNLEDNLENYSEEEPESTE